MLKEKVKLTMKVDYSKQKKAYYWYNSDKNQPERVRTPLEEDPRGGPPKRATTDDNFEKVHIECWTNDV